MYIYIPKELCETVVVSVTWIIGIKLAISVVGQMLSKATRGTRK